MLWPWTLDGTLSGKSLLPLRVQILFCKSIIKSFESKLCPVEYRLSALFAFKTNPFEFQTMPCIGIYMNDNDEILKWVAVEKQENRLSFHSRNVGIIAGTLHVHCSLSCYLVILMYKKKKSFLLKLIFVLFSCFLVF